MTFKILLTFFFCFSAFSYVPNLRAIFRNPSNKDIEKNLILVKLAIKKTPLVSTEENSQNTTETLASPDDQASSQYVKILFDYSNPKDRIPGIQVVYSSAMMKDSEIINLKYIPNLAAPLSRDQLGRAFFYVHLYQLLLNRENEIYNLLFQNDPQMMEVSDVNTEKKNYLLQYLNFLRAKKTAKQNEEEFEGENPLRPTSYEKKQEVRRLFKKPFYNDSPFISLELKAGQTQFKVQTENYLGFFDAQKRRPLSSKFSNLGQVVSMTMSQYSLFNGVHSLPAFILLEDSKMGQYEIQLTYLRHLGSKKKFSERWKEYLKKKSKITFSELTPAPIDILF